MIVYSATKADFIRDVCSNCIDDKILAIFERRMGHSVANSEVQSWKNSMQYMHTLLSGSQVPEDAGVAIEYNIPQSSKRVDFILTGQNADRRDTAVIVELKQWSEAARTNKQVCSARRPV